MSPATIVIAPSLPSVIVEPPDAPSVSFDAPSVPTATFSAPGGAVLTLGGSGTSLIVDASDLPSLAIEAPVQQVSMGVPIPLGGGESNTATNVGGEAGVFDVKFGTDLRFRTLRSLFPALTIVENAGNKTVDFSLLEGFSATCQPSDAVGSIVHVTSSGSGSVPDVTAVDISSETSMRFIGVIVSKPTATTCNVQSSGIATGFTSLTPGVNVFASETNGQITQSQPTASGNHVQRIGVAVSATSFLIDKYSPIKL